MASLLGLALVRRLARLLAWGAVLVIRGYQVGIRPLLIGSCKFCPSCSEYAITALQRHGLLRGGSLAIRRLLRCHPFGPGGIDPVP
ncbi:MAG: membrane protein insertion efficiency factor YidD [Phycisphaerae bacterium]|nr:membrane protein insertion efficiency factor YidD [Phycisphaerae bacterium]